MTIQKLVDQMLHYLVTNNLVKERNLVLRFENDLKPLIQSYGDSRDQEALLREGAKLHKAGVQLAEQRATLAEQEALIINLFRGTDQLIQAFKRLKDKNKKWWDEEWIVVKETEDDLNEWDTRQR